jgi:sporulation protein YlmC with PRC-barrel domain
MFMLLTIKNMLGAPVMSLQTGQPLAKLGTPIINPHNLKIVAFYVSGSMVDFSPAVLFSEDIREFGEMGAIVDSSDNILSPEGMVRLNEVISYGFVLSGVHVVDEQNHKLGRVENYTLNPDDFMIQQLYLKPTIMKSLSVAHLTVGRDQIVAIDNDKITVKTPTVREKTAEKVKTPTNPDAVPFDNPFRKPKPATENTETRL